MRDRSRPGHFARTWAESAWLFQSVTENLDQCVCVLDREGRCLAVNDGFCRWLKRSRPDLLGRPLAEFWPSPTPNREADEHERVLRGEWIEKEEERPRGEQTCWVRLRKAPLRDAAGQVCGVLCLFREVRGEPFVPALSPGGNRELVLALLGDIVRRAGGWIKCASQGEGGLRLSVELPAPSAEPLATAASYSPEHLQKVVLLVEPDVSVLLLAATVLSQQGFRVLGTTTGHEAAELYRRHQETIALAVLEETLPDRSGLELLNDLLACNSGLPVVLVSGAGMPEPSWPTNLPNLRFLSKPYTPEQLLQAVWSVLSAEPGKQA